MAKSPKPIARPTRSRSAARVDRKTGRFPGSQAAPPGPAPHGAAEAARTGLQILRTVETLITLGQTENIAPGVVVLGTLEFQALAIVENYPPEERLAQAERFGTLLVERMQKL